MPHTELGPQQIRRVLFITPFVWVDGQDVGMPSVYETLRGYRDRGFDVHVLMASSQPGTSDIDIDGFHVHYFGVPVNTLGYDFDYFHALFHRRLPHRRISSHLRFRLFWFQFILAAIFRGLTLTRLFSFALVYGMTHLGIPPASFLGWVRGVPSVSRLFGSFTLARRRFARQVRWSSLLDRFDEILAFKLPCGLLVLTDDGTEADKIARNLRVPESRIRCWRNGIRLTDIPADFGDREQLKVKLGTPKDSKVVISTNSLVPWKRVDWLVNALPEVVARHLDVVVIVLGDGEQRAILETLSRRLKVHQHVRFLGYVPKPEVLKYLAVADVFTSFMEASNIGNTLIEAMSLGKCIVTLDTGATGELIRDGQTGRLLNPSQRDQIGTVIADLLSDPAESSRLGNNARALARRRFVTWEARMDLEVHEVTRVLLGFPDMPEACCASS